MMAGELVNATSQLMDCKIINIMDKNGIIIASSNKERIGSLHMGAVEVIRTGKELLISKEMLPRYAGSKEGCNMPIILRGELVGVIGIKGNPDDLLEMAHLLKIYAEKYFELEHAINQSIVEKELKNKLFTMFLTFNENDKDDIDLLVESLGLRLVFPLRILVIRYQKSAEIDLKLEILASKLREYGLLSDKNDIFNCEGANINIIKDSDKNEINTFTDKIHSIAKDMNMQIRIAVSPLVYDLFSIHRFYTRALSAAKYMNEAVIYLDDTKTLLDYMLSLSERENKDFIKRKISELEQNISKEDLDLCLLTAKAYYENDRHVGAAAEKLYIHKNTLMNRMKRVFKVKGVEPLLSVMAYSGAFPSFHHRRTTSPSVS